MTAWLPSVLIWIVGVSTGAYLTHALHPLWCRGRCLCDYCASLRAGSPR